MNSISNTYLNQSSLSTQANQTSSSNQVGNESTDKKQKSVKLDSSEIVVSSRAQKLKALASEFFSGGVNAADLNALKQRAYEYGLINQGQYKSLTTGIQASTAQTSANTSQSLAEELEKVSKELEKRNKEVPEDKRQDVSSITDVLRNTAVILKDPETAITKAGFSEQIVNTKKQLNDIISSDTFSNLPLSERVAMTNSASALSLVESLAPRNLSNVKLNQYLANSF